MHRPAASSGALVPNVRGRRMHACGACVHGERRARVRHPATRGLQQGTGRPPCWPCRRPSSPPPLPRCCCVSGLGTATPRDKLCHSRDQLARTDGQLPFYTAPQQQNTTQTCVVREMFIEASFNASYLVLYLENATY
jgi:hypothetical protein